MERVLTYRRAVRLAVLCAVLAMLGVLMMTQSDIPWATPIPMITSGLIAVLFFGVQARLYKPEACPQN